MKGMGKMGGGMKMPAGKKVPAGKKMPKGNLPAFQKGGMVKGKKGC